MFFWGHFQPAANKFRQQDRRQTCSSTQNFSVRHPWDGVDSQIFPAWRQKQGTWLLQGSAYSRLGVLVHSCPRLELCRASHLGPVFGPLPRGSGKRTGDRHTAAITVFHSKAPLGWCIFTDLPSLMSQICDIFFKEKNWNLIYYKEGVKKCYFQMFL